MQYGEVHMSGKDNISRFLTLKTVKIQIIFLRWRLWKTALLRMLSRKYRKIKQKLRTPSLIPPRPPQEIGRRISPLCVGLIASSNLFFNSIWSFFRWLMANFDVILSYAFINAFSYCLLTVLLSEDLNALWNVSKEQFSKTYFVYLFCPVVCKRKFYTKWHPPGIGGGEYDPRHAGECRKRRLRAAPGLYLFISSSPLSFQPLLLFSFSKGTLLWREIGGPKTCPSRVGDCVEKNCAPSRP